MDLDCIILNKVPKLRKKKNGCSPSNVAYNVNTCKCGYTLTFSMKTQKGHYQVMRRARSYKRTHASRKMIQS